MKIIIIIILFFYLNLSYSDENIGKIFGALGSILEGGQEIKKSREAMGPVDEFFLGREAAARLLGNYTALPVDHPLHKYVNQVGSTLQLSSNAPYLYQPYTYIVLNSTEINAFASPGGIIMITLGMLKFVQNEDELAAILAHEIGHVEMEHGVRAVGKAQALQGIGIIGRGLVEQTELGSNESTAAIRQELTKGIVGFIRNGYSVELESEADARAMILLYEAGYNPYALAEIIERFKNFTGSYGGAGYPEERGSLAYQVLEDNNYPSKEPYEIRTQRFQEIMQNY